MVVIDASFPLSSAHISTLPSFTLGFPYPCAAGVQVPLFFIKQTISLSLSLDASTIAARRTQPSLLFLPKSNQHLQSDIICQIMLQSPAQSVTRIRHKRYGKASPSWCNKHLSPSRLSPVMAMSDVHTRHKQKPQAWGVRLK